jgi:hypothetical protein
MLDGEVTQGWSGGENEREEDEKRKKGKIVQMGLVMAIGGTRGHGVTRARALRPVCLASLGCIFGHYAVTDRPAPQTGHFLQDGA